MKTQKKNIIDVSGKSGRQEVILNRAGMEVKIIGAFQLAGNTKHELSLFIVHKAPRTHAETELRGVVEGHASLTLSGTIIIEKKAQKSESFLREKVLLLSPTAKAEAVPNLEILADDVKCSHAATMSNISEEQIFYLMSRGLTRKKAEEMIVEGFLQMS